MEQAYRGFVDGHERKHGSLLAGYTAGVWNAARVERALGLKKATTATATPAAETDDEGELRPVSAPVSDPRFERVRRLDMTAKLTAPLAPPTGTVSDGRGPTPVPTRREGKRVVGVYPPRWGNE